MTSDESSLRERRGLDIEPIERRWLAAGGIVLFGVFVHRWATFQLVLYDTAVTGHVYWRLAHGLSDVSSLNGTHHLADHLSIWGLALTPFFRLGADVGLLVYGALQAASAMLVSAAVLAAARWHGISTAVARRLAALTAIGPGIYLVSQFGVREMALGVGPLAVTAALSLDGSPDRKPAVWAAITSAVRVEYALAVLLLGLANHRSRSGRVLAATGGLAFAVLAAWLLFGPLDGASTAAHFGHLGESPMDIVRAAFASPSSVVAPVLESTWLRSVVGWLLPFGLVAPLLRPRVMVAAIPFVAIPILGTWELADAYPEHYWHPLVALASVATVAVLASRTARLVRLFTVVMAAATIAAWALFFPFGSRWLVPGGSDAAPYLEVVAAARQDDDRLSATAPLVHRLLDRPVVYALPDPFVCESIGGAVRSDPTWPALIVGPVGVADDIERTTGFDLSIYESMEVDGFVLLSSTTRQSGCTTVEKP